MSGFVFLKQTSGQREVLQSLSKLQALVTSPVTQTLPPP